MSKKDIRVTKIIEILSEQGGASVKDLSVSLGVSEMTIRRDLEVLRNDNIINYVHGAAIMKPGQAEGGDYHLVSQKVINSDEKNKIGRAAAGLIAEGDVIIIDTGTTTEMLARHIDKNAKITVLCYNINTLNEIIKKNLERLIVAGGYYHYGTQMFESDQGIETIKSTRANKIFLSAAGVDEKLGLTCINNYETKTKIAGINSSLEKILLVDSSKFDKVKSSYFGGLDGIDTVVTDSGITDRWRGILADLDIKLIVV